jgi:hypothetical protein
MLPDLRQAIPNGIGLSLIDGAWRLGFDSTVTNDGPGFLKISGTGPGDETMVADQIIQMSDGTTTTVPAIGNLKYVRSPLGAAYPHNHFHFLDFERYELRLPGSGQTLVKDEKTGFCLANAFTTDLCGRNHPELTSVEEGLSVHGWDTYGSNVEGQYITIDPVSVPTGDYVLVHRVNPTGAFAELDPSNDAASVRLNIIWSSGGAPTATVTNKCYSSDCPAPPPAADPPPASEPAPPPEAQPPQQQQSTADPQQPAAAARPPEPVPILSPAEFTRRPEQATMSREMAGRLVRRAIQKSVKDEPQKLRTKCIRRQRDTFTCSASWTGAGAARWTGQVRVWYRLKNASLSWFYDLSATRRPGGKRVVARGAHGSASSALFAGAASAMLCGRIDLGW